MVRSLGRRYAPDLRDRNYPMKAALPAAPSTRISRYWNANGFWGDQGETSQCVAYSWVHYLEDGPVGQRGTAPCVNPVALYREAQKIDEWPGEDYDGTSVRAGAKVLKAQGWISAYRWAQTFRDITQALLEKGPVVMGTNWFESMFDPDEEGFVHIAGDIVGGHAWILDGINEKTRIVRAKNSWGRDWGRNGFFYLSYADLTRLFLEDGEACLADEIKK